MVSRTRKIAAGVVAAVVVVGAGLLAYKATRPKFDGTISALGLDLSAPYGYLATPALSRLPRDMVQAPVLRDLLTEDFAFYYEEQEDRLSLRGAVKRIAYEHQLTLPDQLLAAALDEPAEMAWWPDEKSAPRYWALAMTRGTLATALQGLAGVAAQDSQLSIVAPVHVNGADVNAYALVLSPRRTLVLLSQGQRVVVLSDPGLLFDGEHHADGHALEVVAGLLSGDAGTQPWRRGLGLGDAAAGQGGSTLVADMRLLSFGYQHFFPGVQALRFDIAAGGAGIRTALRVKGGSTLPASPGDRVLWSALPADPAACAMLPADWAQAAQVLAAPPAQAGDAKPAEGKAKPPEPAAWKAFMAQLDGPAAVCWYARSQLHTPLFVARTREGADKAAADTVLAALAQWMVPDAAQDQTPAARPQATLWQSQVDAPWGPYANGDNKAYKPTLAHQGPWIAFSPDDKLVDLALDTQAKRFPSVLDAVGEGPGTTLAVGAPAQIANLLQREAFAVLPADQEVLLQAARQHLVPRFDALRKLGPVRAVAQGAADGNGWVAVDWQALQAARPAAAK